MRIRQGILFFLALLSCSSLFAQGFSLTSSSIPLEEAVAMLAKTLQVDLIYQEEEIPDILISLDIQTMDPLRAIEFICEKWSLELTELSSGTLWIKGPEADAFVRGGLVDQDGNPIAGAHVFLDNELAVSDKEGQFRFDDLLPYGHAVIISHVGYATHSDTLVAGHEDSFRTISLTEQTLEIDGTVVAGLAPRQWESVVSRGDMLRLPERPDVASAAGSLPGVRRALESSDIHIHGGGSGEHQLKINGIPVFDPVSLGGLISSFNPYSVRTVRVHKSGFGARYGSFLSGVVEADHDVSGIRRATSSMIVDQLGGQATLEAPLGIINPIGAIAASFRTGFGDLYRAKPIVRHLTNLSAPDYHFGELPLLQDVQDAPDAESLAAALRALDRFRNTRSEDLPSLVFSEASLVGRVNLTDQTFFESAAFSTSNRLESDQIVAGFDGTLSDRYRWTNRGARATLRGHLNRTSRFSIGGLVSSYSLDHEATNLGASANPADDGNSVLERSATASIETANGLASLIFGAGITRFDSQFAIDDGDSGEVSTVNGATLASGFFEGQFSLSPVAILSYGSRFTRLLDEQESYFEPRAELSFTFDRATLKLASGIYRQYLTQLDFTGQSIRSIVPTIRMWIPVNGSTRAPFSTHLSMFATVDLTPNLRAHAEGYYKSQDHLLMIDYDALRTTLEARADQPINQSDFTYQTDGYALGAATSVALHDNENELSLTYTHGDARRNYANYSGMQPTPWTIPHALDLRGSFQRHGIFFASVRWRVMTGRTWGFRDGYYNYLHPNEERHAIMREPGKDALPVFNQVDVGMRLQIPLDFVKLEFRLDVSNLLDSKTVSEWRLGKAGSVDAVGRTTRFLPRQTALFSGRLIF